MTALYSTIAFVLGSVFGSFLNAWIVRVHNRESILVGRSKCTDCNRQIAWYDNIPIVSFVLLRGKCRHCNKQIHWQYPLIELWMGLLFAWLFVTRGLDLLVVRDLIIVYLLTFIFVYDKRYHMILDRVTLIPAAILFICSIMLGWHTWQSMLGGAGIAGGFFLVQYIVSKGKWIGGGDVRLGVFMGVILGWQLVLLALYLTYVIGSLVLLPFIIMKKKTLKTAVPLGTYLAISTVITMFWGEALLTWYLSLL